MYTANEYIAKSLKIFLKTSVIVQMIVGCFYLMFFILSFYGFDDSNIPNYSILNTFNFAIFYTGFEMGFKKCVFDDKKNEKQDNNREHEADKN